MTTKAKLQEWQKEIAKTATEHGWHETEQPVGVYMCLIMTEVAEAVEADRMGRNYKLTKNDYKAGDVDDDISFKNFYLDNIKGTVGEEFADIVIRLLDYSGVMWPEGINLGYAAHMPHRDNFAENAWAFSKYVLSYTEESVSDSIWYVIKWAEFLGIDLEQNIIWKMRYNKMRPYKHGGKKY